MPPSQRSTSSRSAHKESSEIPTDSNYTLGEYSFRIERSSVPGSTNDKIEAICTKGGKNARKSIQISSSTRLLGWYVEANDTTADVYISIKDQGPNVPYDLIHSGSSGGGSISGGITFVDTFVSGSGLLTHTPTFYGIIASTQPGSALLYKQSNGYSATINLTSQVTYANKTAYYVVTTPGSGIITAYPMSALNIGQYSGADIAWTMLYGNETSESQVLVGRFAIDLEDAGGVGPGSDWDDPGDYDDGWEPGDPTYTLHVEIDGALSGRHNDPLNDTSYSYVPADKASLKDYGCGGDGGNGGGGGAGASSIVVFKFATDQANSKEIVCKPKRHGYGSGGGKGGKGGDGCILVYY